MQVETVQAHCGYTVRYATYYTLDEPGRANEYYAKAFQLRERVSEGEKLVIAAAYYGYATGQLDKAAQTFEEVAALHPRGTLAYNGLAVLYRRSIMHGNSIEAANTLLQLDPDSIFGYTNLSNANLAMQRFDEARQALQRAHTRNLDDYLMRTDLYALAFLGADSKGMAEQQKWFASQPPYRELWATAPTPGV